MNQISKEWLDFLRQQFPEGSRIKLREMKDDICPVEPGSVGTLYHIDDTGSFHVKFDNGRDLGLLLGEDSFSVLPPEAHLLKLYMPMTVGYFEYGEWGEPGEEEITLDPRSAAKYASYIIAALKNEAMPNEAERGLMTYYGKDDSVNRKVRSYTFTAEVRDGRLWGVAECQVQGNLTPEELELLKEDIAGQASDGFGEGVEQREIDVGGHPALYAHLWQWENWDIKTEEERFSPTLANDRTCEQNLGARDTELATTMMGEMTFG